MWWRERKEQKNKEEKATQNPPQQKNDNRDVITYRKVQTEKHATIPDHKKCVMFHVLDLKLKVGKKRLNSVYEIWGNS